MLAHRSIVRVFDLVEEEDGTLALVMELPRRARRSSAARASRARSTPEVAIAIAVPILGALDHAHADRASCTAT